MANVKNLASGTLAEAITASSTTLSVYVGDGSASTIKDVWPATPFYATIMPTEPQAGVPNRLDSEIVNVTAVSNDQVGNVVLTVTRAQRGTTAKSFTAGAIVTNGIYAEDVVPPYSTTETATLEKWIDGRTIYKKTINFGSLPNNNTKRVDLNISNLKKIVKIDQHVTNGSDDSALVLMSSSVNNTGFNLYISNQQICVGTNSDRSSISAYFTVYYTKTS